MSSIQPTPRRPIITGPTKFADKPVKRSGTTYPTDTVPAAQKKFVQLDGGTIEAWQKTLIQPDKDGTPKNQALSYMTRLFMDEVKLAANGKADPIAKRQIMNRFMETLNGVIQERRENDGDTRQLRHFYLWLCNETDPVYVDYMTMKNKTQDLLLSKLNMKSSDVYYKRSVDPLDHLTRLSCNLQRVRHYPTFAKPIHEARETMAKTTPPPLYQDL
jgi:hypothetical protein